MKNKFTIFTKAKGIFLCGIFVVLAAIFFYMPLGHKEIVAQEYRNEKYYFSLFYPEGFSYKEYEEKYGAFTVTFQEDGGEKGFQVFITPYYDIQITPERLKLDIPSGVVKEPTSITIDGVKASIFFSTNTVLGDTREVWFIRNGFLYEVTTFAELDSWLAEIMKSWKFL